MPRDKLRRDLNETAYNIVRAATNAASKPLPAGKQHNAVAAERGSQGGKRGGKVRAVKLSAKRRAAIAKQAARARWKGHSE